MENPIKIVQLIIRLGNGAIIGAGLLGVIYLLWPGIFPATVSVEIIILIGGLFGGGCQKLITIAKNSQESRKDTTLIENLQKLRYLVVNGYLSPSKELEMEEMYIAEEKLKELKKLEDDGIITVEEALLYKNELLTKFLPPQPERRQIRGGSDDESNR